MSAPAPVSYTPTESPANDRRILSYLQAKRCLRKQHQHVLLFVDKLTDSGADEAEKQDPSVTENHRYAVESLIEKHACILMIKCSKTKVLDLICLNSFLLF